MEKKSPRKAMQLAKNESVDFKLWPAPFLLYPSCVVEVLLQRSASKKQGYSLIPGISVELQFHPTRGRTLTSHLTQVHIKQTLFPLGKTEWTGAANSHPVPIHTVRSLPKVQQAENFGTQWPLPHLPVQQFHTGKDKSGHIYRRQNRLSLKNHKKRQRNTYTMIKG